MVATMLSMLTIFAALAPVQASFRQLDSIVLVQQKAVVAPAVKLKTHPAPAPAPEDGHGEEGEEDTSAGPSQHTHVTDVFKSRDDTSKKIVAMTAVGTFVGACFGSAIGGITWGGPEAWFGGLFGAFFGGAVGWAGGYGALMAHSDNQHEMVEPFSEKLEHLAGTLVALTTMLEHNKSLSKSEHARIKNDTEFINEVLHHIDAEIAAGVPATEEDFHEIEEILSHEDYAKWLSAESASADGETMTAHDVAVVEGMENQEQAEDKGPGGDLPSHEGDMVPENPNQLLLFQEISRMQQMGNLTTPAAGHQWNNGWVPYCFASDVPTAVKHIFEAATKNIANAVPCITFKNVGWASGTSLSDSSQQRCQGAGPAIFVQSNPNEGCYSYVGMVGHWASQKLQLQNPGCVTIGTAVHEIGHALGMAHEQARPDRDVYVEIRMSNVAAGFEHNFKKQPLGHVGAKYDFTSIMHYDAFAFARDHAKPTIVEKGHAAHTANELGQRIGLSDYDSDQLVDMYNTYTSGGCAKNTLGELGCIDKPADDGSDYCSSLTQCNAKAVSKCCGCGGGVKVQCYKGATCPSTPPLPPPAGADCIVDKSILYPQPATGCVFTNACDFSVKWKCPNTGCEQVTPPGSSLWQQFCGSTMEYEICQGLCTVVQA